jgi:hypothetical protein
MFAPPIARTKPKSSAAPRSTAMTPSPSRAGVPQPLNTMGDRARLKPPVQPKLKVGDVDDPLEREADRVAGQVVTGPDAQPPRLRADRPGALPEPERTKSPESFSGGGDPLPAPLRGYFERRFDHDFTGVRLHKGPDAARSALSFGARAYTYGRDIVFGAGEFSPSSNRGLLAHELAHVVQQGAGQPLVQRSPLSDEIKEAWTKAPKIETLLARLSKADVQAAQTDADVDTEIASILASRPDDLWLAERIRQGKLGDTTGKFHPTGKPQPIKAFFFAGSTDRRALVIGGVHGTEKQGIDVAEMLIADLQSAAVPPVLTTIVVPSLFPDNAAAGTRNSGKETDPDVTPTNRNFPDPSQDLAAAEKAGGGTAKDALKKVILPENQLLMKLMERFKPERIISIHGTHHLGAAGISFDRRSLRADELAKASVHVGRARPENSEGYGEASLMAMQKLFKQRSAEMLRQAEKADTDLALGAAKQIDTATAGITGRDARDLDREHDPKGGPGATATAERKAHPSIAGNVGKTGKIDFAQWSGGGSDPGFSLGGYAPARGMSLFTVEPPVDAPLSDYPIARDPKDPKKPDKTKWAKDRVSREVDKLLQAERITELKAYADAVRTVLLGS